MKKFLSIMTLVLALCLACGVAMAGDLKTAPAEVSPSQYVILSADRILVVVGEDSAEFDLEISVPLYKDVAEADLDEFVVVKKADCVNNAEVALLPFNYDLVENRAGYLFWNEQKDAYTGLTYELAVEVAKSVAYEDLTKAQAEEFKALGHDLKYIGDTATCDAPGKAVAVCQREGCGYKADEFITPAKKHTPPLTADDIKAAFEDAEGWKYGSVYTKGTAKYVLIAKPTCSAKGSYEGPCAVCKKTATFEIAKDENAHVYGEWIVRAEATCNKPGLKYQICMGCKKENKKVIPVRENHWFVYAKVVEESNCVDTGLAEEIHCKYCDIVFNWNNMHAQNAATGTITNDEISALTAAGVWKYTSNVAGTRGYWVVAVNPKNHATNAFTKVGYDEVFKAADGFEYTSKKPACAASMVSDGKGTDYYYCDKCNAIVDSVKTNPTGHNYVEGTFKVVDAQAGKYELVKKTTCELGATDNKGNPIQFTYQTIKYCKNELVGTALTFNKDKHTKVGDSFKDAHNFGEWYKYNDPSETTLGKWTRKCEDCNYVETYYGASAPVDGLGKTLALNEDGVWAYYENGKFTKKTAFVEFEGATFAVVDGLVATDINGLVTFPENATDGKKYYIGAGMLQKVTGLVQYDGEWFYVKDGEMSTEYDGLIDYDGSKFMLAAGRIVTEANGLLQDPTNALDWYYLANGQVQTQYTGVVLYDGAAFYVVNGKLDINMYGTIEYDGVLFAVVSGQLYAL